MFDVNYPTVYDLKVEGKKAVDYVKDKALEAGQRLHDFCTLSARIPPRGL